MIRTLLVKHGNCPPQKLHERASKLVKASAQAEMIENLMPVLSEEEITIYKRGRNAKSYTKAKNATVADYRKATGLEALMGYLYLKEDTKRIIELIRPVLIWQKVRKRKVRNRHEIRRTYHRRQKCRAGSIRSGKTIDKLFVLDGCQDGPVRTILREAKKHDTIVQFVKKERLDQLSQTGHHQGVIASAAAYEYAEISDILQNAKDKGEAPFIIFLDNIEDPHNLGAIIRTANLAGHMAL